jgi:hypothetical protein
MAVSDKLVQKMRENGTISSADVADFESPQANRADRGKALAKTTVAKVPDEASKDPSMKMSETTSTEKLQEVQQQADLGRGPDELANEMYDGDDSEPEFEDEKVELTPADKDAFVDAMVTGGRYERPFELFGGRVMGVFRSRTSAESLAILKELARQWTIRKFMSESEYSTMLRWGMLKAHLKELNGVQYAEMKEPLTAQSTVEADGKEVVKEPEWFKEMHAQFGSKDEGLYTAVYREVRTFEKKYWALVAHAKDQNFWKPSQSTSA